MSRLPVISGEKAGTVEFSSEITISLNFTAEHAENAKASGKLSKD
jgi:hypothetical protein